MRIRFAKGFWTSRLGLTLLISAGVLFIVSAATFAYFYIHFSRMIDARLSGQVFQNTSRVFAAPRRIAPGTPWTPNELAGYLQRAGYTEASVEGAPGQYSVSGATVEIRPSSYSYFAGKNALRVEFKGRQVEKITLLDRGKTVASAELEPEPVTNLFDSSREKRRLVRYDDLPKLVVDSVLAAEDKRFFDHPGFDPIRVVGAAWADVRKGGIAQGASTITMQLARSFFFSLERKGWGAWRRKGAETMVALQLEQRFSKQQIFELYANEVYLGNRGSFAIHGFAEAARAYFGKDIRELSLGEAAFLAGIIRAPNRYSVAERNPERVAEARDRVLAQMVENKTITEDMAESTRKAPLRLVRSAVESSAAPYFVDMVKDYLEDRYTESDLSGQSFRIYTTLDPLLQRAGSEAIEAGLKEVDKLLAKKYERWRKRGEAAPLVQVALVAMDPRTGEIKALIGGRGYGLSQLNHAVARRQPGSVFKPFIYAAAFDNAVDGVDPVVTPVTTVVDEPTTFLFGDQEYTPNNYGEEFHGTVTAREALYRSLNVATVKVAELIGYDRVVQVVRQMGLDPRIQPTPAVALGAYEMTPIDVAAGYTVFATGGVRAEPMFLRSVIGSDGRVLEQNRPRIKAVLDPRVAYLVNTLLQDVVNRGTGAGVRTRGFTAPAAGKTGTSHDGWFAGFTSNLLCVVWVGFDDYRELGLSGASTAAPIWAEFMKRATAMPELAASLGTPAPFSPPEGVVAVPIDPETLQLATSSCPATRVEYFVAGTEPTEFCALHGGRGISQIPPVSWLSRMFGGKGQGSAAPPAAAGTKPAPDPSNPEGAAPAPVAASGQKAEEQKKKGILQRVFGIFGGGNKKQEKPQTKPAKPGG